MQKGKKLEFSEIPEDIGFTEDQIKFIRTEGADAGREAAQKKFDDYFSSIITAIKDIPGNTRDEVKKDIDPLVDTIRELRTVTYKLKDKVNVHDHWLYALTGATAVVIIILIVIFAY